MAKPQVLEGTWEEIKQHEAELTGRWLRVIVGPEAEYPHTPTNGSMRAQTQGKDQPKQLRGRGMFKGMLGGTESLFKQKQEDIQREERRFLNYVLDASAMVAYLEGEPGDIVVDGLLSDPGAVCYAHAVNLCEVFYQGLRSSDLRTARLTIATLFADGVIERRDMSRRFWQRVGQLKARGGISLADCFGIALTQQLGAEIVTSDHHEFDPLVPLGIVSIRFIR